MRCEFCGGTVDLDHACDFFRHYGFERSAWLMATTRQNSMTRAVRAAQITAPSAPPEDSTTPSAGSATAAPADTFDTSTG
jgi:hypothetical protein